MADLLAWLEGSPLGHAMRNAGSWSYGVVNLIHILGVGSLFGAVLLLDLRLLGAWRSIPLASIARPPKLNSTNSSACSMMREGDTGGAFSNSP